MIDDPDVAIIPIPGGYLFAPVEPDPPPIPISVGPCPTLSRDEVKAIRDRAKQVRRLRRV